MLLIQDVLKSYGKGSSQPGIVKNDILNDEKYGNLFTVEKVNELTISGIPFREAYKQVGKLVAENEFVANVKLNHTHQGSIGNLCNDKIVECFNNNSDI